MLITCWSAKGGSGTTTVACALATLLAARHPAGCLLLDGCGDVPGALGLARARRAGPGGVAGRGGWRAPARRPALRAPRCPWRPAWHWCRGAWARSGLPPGSRPSPGRSPPRRARWWSTAGVLAVDHAELVPLASGAARSLLVAAGLLPVPAAGRPRAVAAVGRGAPGRAGAGARPGRRGRGGGRARGGEVALDPAVARAVDAGLLPLRLPRGGSPARWPTSPMGSRP